MGSVHARKYGFPFQQPSTSCGTHSALFVYRLANYLIIHQLAKQKQYNAIISVLSLYRYYFYAIIEHKIRKSTTCNNYNIGDDELFNHVCVVVIFNVSICIRSLLSKYCIFIKKIKQLSICVKIKINNTKENIKPKTNYLTQNCKYISIRFGSFESKSEKT